MIRDIVPALQFATGFIILLVGVEVIFRLTRIAAEYTRKSRSFSIGTGNAGVPSMLFHPRPGPGSLHILLPSTYPFEVKGLAEVSPRGKTRNDRRIHFSSRALCSVSALYHCAIS